MKNIKKIKQQFIISFLCLVLPGGLMLSCSDRLEEPVYDFWGDDFFSSTDNLNMGVRGIVASFSNQDTYGQSWMVFDCDTDISHISGTGIGHLARDLGHYNAYASHSWLEAAWSAYYRAIERANYILDKKEDVQVEDSDKDRVVYRHLIAEARVLRALAYFDLVRLFGDVPYKEHPSQLGTEDMAYSRTDMREIYETICRELEDAVDDLCWHDEFPDGYTGRFSRGAGHALLCRVYLFRGGWSLRPSGQMERVSDYQDYYKKAIEHADVVIGSGKHGLNPSYERVFRNMCELQLEPVENMHEFQFYSASAQKGGSSTMGTYNGPIIAQESSFGRANSFIKTNMFFYDTFEDDDLRKDVAVATWRINVVDGIDTYVQIPRNQSYTWAPGKWRRDWQTSAVLDPNYTNVNWVFLRYADVLLMKAEAENELYGPTASAIECMNQVKRRAYGYDYRVAEVTIDYDVADFDKLSFFEEIKAERARELCFEGHRRMDLIRWNQLPEAMKEIKVKFDEAIAAGQLREYDYDGSRRFTANKHELYPLPAREILETGNTWQQNPGYGE